MYWVNVPFAAIAIVLTLAAVPESRDPAPRPLDLPGAATSALGLVGIALGLVETSSRPWSAAPVLVSLVVGAGCLICFALRERRTAHPMVPPELLAARSFVSASAVYLISDAAFSGVLFYVTLLYQDVDGWSPLRTGLSWLFMNVPFLLMAQLTGGIARRQPPAGVVGAGCPPRPIRRAGAAGAPSCRLPAGAERSREAEDLGGIVNPTPSSSDEHAGPAVRVAVSD